MELNWEKRFMLSDVNHGIIYWQKKMKSPKIKDRIKDVIM